MVRLSRNCITLPVIAISPTAIGLLAMAVGSMILCAPRLRAMRPGSTA